MQQRYRLSIITSPLRNNPPNDSLSYRSLLKHRTRMAPHRNIESCDQETAWLTGIGSDSKSKIKAKTRHSQT